MHGLRVPALPRGLHAPDLGRAYHAPPGMPPLREVAQAVRASCLRGWCSNPNALRYDLVGTTHDGEPTVVEILPESEPGR